MRAAFCAIAVLSFALLGKPLLAAEMFDDGYKPCGDQASTMEIVGCVQAKTKVWDQRLNKAYTVLQQHIDPGQRAPLTQAQRLWIQFRDANCRFYGSADGTIREINATECVRVLTENRALELEAAARP